MRLLLDTVTFLWLVADPDALGARAREAIVDPGNDKQLVLTLPPLVPGRYRVHWHVVSVDTHRTEGEYSFAVEP